MNMDDDLSLKQILSRADDLEPALMIRVYFDPKVNYFYIRFCDVLPLFVPDNAYLIGECSADNVEYIIEKFLADAIFRFIKSKQS